MNHDELKTVFREKERAIQTKVVSFMRAQGFEPTHLTIQDGYPVLEDESQFHCGVWRTPLGVGGVKLYYTNSCIFDLVTSDLDVMNKLYSNIGLSPFTVETDYYAGVGVVLYYVDYYISKTEVEQLCQKNL